MGFRLSRSLRLKEPAINVASNQIVEAAPHIEGTITIVYSAEDVVRRVWPGIVGTIRSQRPDPPPPCMRRAPQTGRSPNIAARCLDGPGILLPHGSALFALTGSALRRWSKQWHLRSSALFSIASGDKCLFGWIWRDWSREHSLHCPEIKRVSWEKTFCFPT